MRMLTLILKSSKTEMEPFGCSEWEERVDKIFYRKSDWRCFRYEHLLWSIMSKRHRPDFVNPKTLI
jgi:hypothetical protein